MEEEQVEDTETEVVESNELTAENVVKFIRLKTGEDIVTQLMTFNNDEDEYYHLLGNLP